ncbi:UNKNOWN [Stylonychia lemnae]|uniref:Uncharacterized protein n=1 Tax=Stylonychia lemnae TaxID=5949 RepID=A0A078AYP6_STYLE|nr:UNKNOWN [Stylonychia lemnae]|eukprot:CDW86337.1 UNKNOWN [Stylonychia lemnae]
MGCKGTKFTNEDIIQTLENRRRSVETKIDDYTKKISLESSKLKELQAEYTHYASQNNTTKKIEITSKVASIQKVNERQNTQLKLLHSQLGQLKSQIDQLRAKKIGDDLYLSQQEAGKYLDPKQFANLLNGMNKEGEKLDQIDYMTKEQLKNESDSTLIQARLEREHLIHTMGQNETKEQNPYLNVDRLQGNQDLINDQIIQNEIKIQKMKNRLSHYVGDLAKLQDDFNLAGSINNKPLQDQIINQTQILLQEQAKIQTQLNQAMIAQGHLRSHSLGIQNNTIVQETMEVMKQTETYQSQQDMRAQENFLRTQDILSKQQLKSNQLYLNQMQDSKDASKLLQNNQFGINQNLSKPQDSNQNQQPQQQIQRNGQQQNSKSNPQDQRSQSNQFNQINQQQQYQNQNPMQQQQQQLQYSYPPQMQPQMMQMPMNYNQMVHPQAFMIPPQNIGVNVNFNQQPVSQGIKQ